VTSPTPPSAEVEPVPERHQLQPHLPGQQPQPVDFETAELRDFSRTVAQIDWLLVILALLYDVFAVPAARNATAIYLGIAAFACCIVALHHLGLVRHRSRRLLAAETGLMVLFVTWVAYHSGQSHGPLLNLYLLPIVTSALGLGQKFTLLVVGVIAACYLLLGFTLEPAYLSTLSLPNIAAELAPMLLVAYVTTMLSTDILNAMAKLKLISQTDELTGIYNVRAFNAIAERDLGLAARYRRPISVMMVDSDNLKLVNDTHGHDTGDQLIRHVAGCIAAELRGTDVVARYGGDEFICLLPHTDGAGAALVAERIRQRVATRPIRLGEADITTSVSIGIAASPEHGSAFDTLVKNADRALYVSKSRGRNCVVVFPDGTPAPA
jgi:diguanylate cyclase (GGDEF)-like protein